MLKHLLLCMIVATSLHAVGYVKGGGGMVACKEVGPTVAFGSRYLVGGYGLELSSQFMMGSRTGWRRAHLWTAPRSLVIGSVGRLFFGAGSSFGGTRLDDKRFLGFFGEAIVGFQPMPVAFVEFGLMQPIKPIKKGNLRRPSISLSLGIGF